MRRGAATDLMGEVGDAFVAPRVVKRHSHVLRRRTRQAALDKPRVHDWQLGFAILEQKAPETAENRAFEEK